MQLQSRLREKVDKSIVPEAMNTTTTNVIQKRMRRKVHNFQRDLTYQHINHHCSSATAASLWGWQVYAILTEPGFSTEIKY